MEYWRLTAAAALAFFEAIAQVYMFSLFKLTMDDGPLSLTWSIVIHCAHFRYIFIVICLHILLYEFEWFLFYTFSVPI